MSKYFSSKYSKLIPYVPGEQPKNMEYVKLNTNESPFPPSKNAIELASNAAKNLNLYSDPECLKLREKLAEIYGVDKDEVICTNGSDEVLNFAFMAFCDDNTPAYFADITYGFYKVFAQLNNVPYKEIPLKDNFEIDLDKFLGVKGTIFIANPNAPTGLKLSISQIENLLKVNKDNIVVIDEAYIDFGGESAVSLIKNYKNLLVTQTFSKSRSLAGGRLGFGIACKELIADLNTIRFSTNPYNVNSMTMMAGIGSLIDNDYSMQNAKVIIKNREWTINELNKLGFTTLDSYANFVFTKTDKISGKDLYLKLKENGVLIRHFETERLKDYNRITIGSFEQMKILIEKIKEIIK